LERIAQTAAAARIDAVASAANDEAGSVEQLVQRLAAVNATLEATLAATHEQHAAALAALQAELDAVRDAHEAAADQARRQLHDAQAALLQSRSWLLAVRRIRHAFCGVNIALSELEPRSGPAGQHRPSVSPSLNSMTILSPKRCSASSFSSTWTQW